MADRNSDWSGLVDAVATMGKAVLPLIVPGAASAINAGEKVIELIDHTKQMVDGDVDVAELNRTRDAFEKTVNAHVEGTVDKLRGEG